MPKLDDLVGETAGTASQPRSEEMQAAVKALAERVEAVESAEASRGEQLARIQRRLSELESQGFVTEDQLADLQSDLSKLDSETSEHLAAIRQFTGSVGIAAMSNFEVIKRIVAGDGVADEAIEGISSMVDRLKALTVAALDQGMTGEEFAAQVEAEFPQDQHAKVRQLAPAVFEEVKAEKSGQLDGESEEDGDGSASS